MKVGVELPAGTLAATPEDRTPAEHHTPPASRVAFVSHPFASTTARLQFYTTTLDDSEQRRFPPIIHKHPDPFTLFLQVENEFHFCGWKKKYSQE